MLEFVNETFFQQLYEFHLIIKKLQPGSEADPVLEGITDEMSFHTQVVGILTQILTTVERIIGRVKPVDLSTEAFMEQMDFFGWFFADNLHHPDQLRSIMSDEDLAAYTSRFDMLYEKVTELRLLPFAEISIANQLKNEMFFLLSDSDRMTADSLTVSQMLRNEKTLSSATHNFIRLMLSIAKRGIYYEQASFISDSELTYHGLVDSYYPQLASMLDKIKLVVRVLGPEKDIDIVQAREDIEEAKKRIVGARDNLEAAKRAYDQLFSFTLTIVEDPFDYIRLSVGSALKRVEMERERTRFQKVKDSILRLIDEIRKSMREYVDSALSVSGAIAHAIWHPIDTIQHAFAALTDMGGYRQAIPEFVRWILDHPFQVVFVLTSATLGIMASIYLPLTGFVGSAVEFSVGAAVGGGLTITTASVHRAVVGIREGHAAIRSFESDLDIAQNVFTTRQTAGERFLRAIDEEARTIAERRRVNVRTEYDGASSSMSTTIATTTTADTLVTMHKAQKEQQLKDLNAYLDATIIAERESAEGCQHEIEKIERESEIRQRKRTTYNASARLLAEMAMVTSDGAGGAGDDDAVVPSEEVHVVPWV